MQKNNTIQAFWVALGSISSIGLSIVSAAILSRYFNKADYGTYKQIIYVYSTLLVIFSAGLPSVFSYFLPRFTLQQGKDIVLKVSKFLFFTGFLFSLFLYVFSGYIAQILKNPALSIGLKAFSPIPMLLLPTLGIGGVFATYQKTLYIPIYESVTRIITLIFILFPIIILHKSYIYAIYGWNLAALLSLIIAIYFKNIPFLHLKAEKVSLSFKEIFAYSLPLLMASLWGTAIKAADQFYISRYFGSEIFADYSNGFIEIPFVAMVTTSVSTVLLPIFSKMFYENSNTEDFIQIWRNALNKSALVIYPMVIFFIFNARDIITIMYSTRYSSSTIYFQIAMLVNFFNIVIFAPLLLSMGETKFYSRLHLFIAICAWGLGYLMVLIFHSPIAIAILSVSLSVLKVIIAFLFVSKLIKISIAKLLPKQIIYYILHSVVVIVFVRFILTEIHLYSNPLLNLSISLVCYVVVLLVSAIPLKLNYLSVIEPFVVKLVGRNK
jgi:O-antigen/teichoic acid export membrane protein